MDLPVPADADYVFDLINPDAGRRAAALARHAELVAEHRCARDVFTVLWVRAGKTRRGG